MSVRATTWAWEKGRELELNPGQRLTLVRIGDHADNDGVCWPGTHYLAEYTGADESTIRRHLKSFEDLDLLHRDHRVRGEGSGRGRAPDAIHLHMAPDDLPGNAPGSSQPSNRAGTPSRSDTDQAGETPGKSESTNRASDGGPTGQSTPDQPGIRGGPYVEEPSGTVKEPRTPPDPPKGGRQSRRSLGRGRRRQGAEPVRERDF